MSFTDKNGTCTDCNKPFIFSASEQEFFASKGFTNVPKRCPECRMARKSSRNGSVGTSYHRQMYPTVCAQCSKPTEVPFEPRLDRPVYCSDCYKSIKVAR